jgi:hypothetical protein
MEETIQSLLSRNRVNEITDNDKRQYGFYLDVVKSFAQITYRSLYVIDYEKMVFEYLCSRGQIIRKGKEAVKVKISQKPFR